MPGQFPPNYLVSTEGPVGMGNPVMDLMRRMMAKRQGDIELPPESGMVDPRILEQSVNPMEQMQKAFKAAQGLATDDALGGLLRARPK